MENTDNKNDLLKGFQKIMEKSIEANTQIMKATSETFTNLVSKQPDWSDLQKLIIKAGNYTNNQGIV